MHRPPLSVCWHLYNSTEEHIINTSNCPLANNSNGAECQALNDPSSFKHNINFASTGFYVLMASFENDANCTVKNYTLKVDDPGESRTTSSAQM